MVTWGRAEGAFCEGPSCTVSICEQCKCSDVLFNLNKNQKEKSNPYK